MSIKNPINLFDFYEYKGKNQNLLAQSRYLFKNMCINKCKKLNIPYICNVSRKKRELIVSAEHKDIILNAKIDKDGHNYGRRKKYSKWDNITFTEYGLSLYELLAKNGIKPDTFYNRIKKGWGFASASTLPRYCRTELQQKRANRKDKAKFMAQSKRKKYR